MTNKPAPKSANLRGSNHDGLYTVVNDYLIAFLQSVKPGDLFVINKSQKDGTFYMTTKPGKGAVTKKEEVSSDEF